ncbi:unnamed protein product [Protopolystoma xenopodis]|uniref:ShKT domain-containing protein n=1 Tax=Protopolystoma xenopodis TaxID=117903 RepID=A0A3S5C768_9PLAT|nr:unnamed protein product [Protopolystoma xenopodis]
MVCTERAKKCQCVATMKREVGPVLCPKPNFNVSSCRNKQITVITTSYDVKNCTCIRRVSKRTQACKGCKDLGEVKTCRELMKAGKCGDIETSKACPVTCGMCGSKLRALEFAGRVLLRLMRFEK